MRRGSYDDAVVSLRPHLRSLAHRRRSAPSLVFGKALSIPWTPIREEALCPVAVEQCPFVLGLANENSSLALDECVQVAEGLKTRERHLFLFSDMLVIAKLKSSASYRLKHRVSLGDLWVYGFEDEEEEDDGADIEFQTSLILAWPLAFCVVTFRSSEVKERWLDTLHRKVSKAKERADSGSPPPSVLMKVLSGNITTKTLTGGGMDSFIELPLDGDGKISTPPRQLCNAEERARQPIENGCSTGSTKWSLLSRKLKRSSTHTGTGKSPLDTRARNPLFGQPLTTICTGDETLPKPVAEVLLLLRKKGPSTEGVFRKPGNSKNLNAIREQLNARQEVDMEALPVVLLVGLLKSFLTELPGSLLVAEHYGSWINALEKEEAQEKRSELKRVVATLPAPNVLLLQQLLCVLHHISMSSATNKMDATNLAVCIAPTLLRRDSQTLDVDTVKKVTNLTQFLIENCSDVFGEDILTLLGDPDEEELGNNSDSMSSHQHDSAYDSTDPDGDPGDAMTMTQTEEEDGRPSSRHRAECSAIPSCPSDAIFDTFNRRCSEPTLFPSAAAMGTLRALARSHDDFSMETGGFEEQTLKKQNSDDSFLLPKRGERRPLLPALRRMGGSLTIDVPNVPGSTSAPASCSSTCSLESAASNLSEGSVFTSSPLASPASTRRSHPAKPRAEPPKADAEVRRRTQSMRADGKVQLRPRSLGPFTFGRGSLKKGEAQKGKPFPCGTLQEDSQSEVEHPEEAPRRQRPLSAVEVFQQVDLRVASCPPSYEQAVLSGSQPAPPQYHAMTVQDAVELGRRSRPTSVNDFSDFCARLAGGDDSIVPEPAFRPRAMSESVSRSRHDRVIRRCSQPVFEELSHAKESYV